MRQTGFVMPLFAAIAEMVAGAAAMVVYVRPGPVFTMTQLYPRSECKRNS